MYDADNMIDWLELLFTTGVFNNYFRVVANDNMTVTVEGRYGNINGRVINQLGTETLDIAMASGTQSRIDKVTLRLYLCQCTISDCLFVHTGTGISVNSCTGTSVIVNKFESSWGFDCNSVCRNE